MNVAIQIGMFATRDLFRNKWSIIYSIFFFIVTEGLLSMVVDPAKVMVSLVNIVLFIIPLVSIIFGATYFYNAREFVKLLLAQPVSRASIFCGLLFGIFVSLCVGFAVGLTIPFMLHGLLGSGQFETLLLLLLVGWSLIIVFGGLALLITLLFDDKGRGMGMAILAWLVLAVLYDGVVLFGANMFSEYPIEKSIIVSTLMNPIDLSRILLIFKMDLSALLGYTGAVFRRFFGGSTGMVVSSLSLVVWCLLPVLLSLRVIKTKDY